jgi:nucleoside-diphosphate-sugar epimerase
MVNAPEAEAYSGKTVLIAGGRGYIGSAVLNLLSSVDCRLILADRSGGGWVPETHLAEIVPARADLTTEEGWRHVLCDVDCVFHFAGLEYDRGSFDWEMDLTSNFLSVARLLSVCRELSTPPRIVFASSANVVGQSSAGVSGATMLDDPLSLWSVHKLMAEKYLRVYALKDGISSTSLRLSNVYGPTANPAVNNRVVLNKVICRALDGNPLTLFANRYLKRDFVHINDVSRAFVAAGSSKSECMMDGRSYYVGSGQALSFQALWDIVAAEVERMTGKFVSIEIDESVPIEPLDMRSFCDDVSGLKDACGWRPEYSPTEGVRQSIATFLKRI